MHLSNNVFCIIYVMKDQWTHHPEKKDVTTVFFSSNFCFLVALQAGDVSITHHSWQYKIGWLFLYIRSQSTTLECSPSLWRRWWATTGCKSCTSPSPRASGGWGSGDTPPSPALLALSSGLGSCQILSMYNKYCSSLLQVIYMGNSMSIGRKERSLTEECILPLCFYPDH